QVLVNPELTAMSEERDEDWEGCLSLPDLRGRVPRLKSIRVRALDRAGRRRTHVHTFGNLIHADFRIPSSDYGDLLKVTSVLTRNHTDVVAAFRHMVFNVATHNRDDHVKNFAFLLDDVTGEWSLSPAYDLTFASGPGGEHCMTVAGEGRHPGRRHILQLARQHGIASKAATIVIDEVRATVDAWPRFAEQATVHPDAAAQIATTLPTLDE
ncbi:MAG: HipA domain-containing protein, partial [bacterium]